MKAVCPPVYHHSGFVATHALGHMMHGLMNSTSCGQVREVPQSHCGNQLEGILYS